MVLCCCVSYSDLIYDLVHVFLYLKLLLVSCLYPSILNSLLHFPETIELLVYERTCSFTLHYISKLVTDLTFKPIGNIYELIARNVKCILPQPDPFGGMQDMHYLVLPVSTDLLFSFLLLLLWPSLHHQRQIPALPLFFVESPPLEPEKLALLSTNGNQI